MRSEAEIRSVVKSLKITALSLELIGGDANALSCRATSEALLWALGEESSFSEPVAEWARLADEHKDLIDRIECQ